MILSAIKAIKKWADFSPPTSEKKVEFETREHVPVTTAIKSTQEAQKLGLNLSYTINLNLPATSDIAVFHAIFKSLKENLLRDIDG